MDKEYLEKLVSVAMEDYDLDSIDKIELFTAWIEKLEEALSDPLPKGGQEVQDLVGSIELLEGKIEYLES